MLYSTRILLRKRQTGSCTRETLTLVKLVDVNKIGTLIMKNIRVRSGLCVGRKGDPEILLKRGHLSEDVEWGEGSKPYECFGSIFPYSRS